MSIHIEEWCNHHKQNVTLGNHTWSVARLIELSRDLEIMIVPLRHLNIATTYEKLYMREFVMHMKAAMHADLKYPIILDEDGEILDGKHRLLKAMYLGIDTIKAVRFDENPTPCKIRG